MTPVVRPKTPRGDGNIRTSSRQRRKSPVVRPKTPRGDGNRMDPGGLALILVVVRPKTPRGDGNSTSISLTSPGEKITSSDPKPRERTETRRRSRRCRCPNRRVVRPKTPRGDGNLERVTADGTIETSRQTQNPERGRKQHLSSTSYADQSSGRQTQNPERGRKHSESHVLTADSHVVRPKTPRGDGNQVSNGGGNLAATGRSSDPKPREGTETGQRSTPALVDFRVVRPKTPRGDGNA
ncbi:Uncharacterised protein [Mycobacterium tuberculosis]|nr:Uncharacterised protein [Mycobacterium tuberculosis]